MRRPRECVLFSLPHETFWGYNSLLHPLKMPPAHAQAVGQRICCAPFVDFLFGVCCTAPGMFRLPSLTLYPGAVLDAPRAGQRSLQTVQMSGSRQITPVLKESHKLSVRPPDGERR